MKRLRPKDLPDFRLKRLEAQGWTCPLCRQPIHRSDTVHADHDHRTGQMRDVLHGACNMGLGKVERAARMTRDPVAFVMNLAGYLEHHQTNQHGLYHPSWLSADEKHARLKRRAKRRRVNRPSNES